MARGRVKHVLLDYNNPEHVEVAKDLGANAKPGKNSGVMLQFFEGKPSGYVEFDYGERSKDAHISHIYVKPEFRDTVSREKMTREEASKKFYDITGKYLDTGKRPNKREEIRLRSIRRAEQGLKRREKQLLLGAKLVKSLNTKLGFNPVTSYGESIQGEKHLKKYMSYMNARGIRKRR